MKCARPATYRRESVVLSGRGAPFNLRRKPMRRSVKEIKADRDAYLDMATILRKLGDNKAAEYYLIQVEAMNKELDYQRCGCTNVL